MEVSGYELPAEVQRRIVERWASSIFDRFLERDVDRIVRDYLFGEGRPQASVTATLAAAGGVRTLRVEIDPGVMAAARLQIDGNEMVPTERVLEAARIGGPAAAWLDPALVEAAIERLYQAEGLLSADVNVSAPEVRDGESVVRVVIQEGGPWQSRTRDARRRRSSCRRPPTSGWCRALSTIPRAIIARVSPGSSSSFETTAFWTFASRQRRCSIRRRAGPMSTRSSRRVRGRVLASIAVDGADGDAAKIAQALSVNAGMPVGASAIGAARRRLYDTGIYRSVEIELEPVPDPSSVRLQPDPLSECRNGRSWRGSVSRNARGTASVTALPSTASVNAAEERDTRVGFAADFENRNLLGRGLTVGLSARLRRDQEVARAFLSANRFFALPLRSTVFLSRSREDIGSIPSRRGSRTSRKSARNKCTAFAVFWICATATNWAGTVTSSSLLDLTVRIARLTTSALVDRRNDPFDPVRGWFSSANMELSRPGLGSELSFLKSYLQLYQFAPLRAGVVLASAARVGLARTFRDEDLIPSEQFFAGGATSVRGYREDDLGPRSIFGDAEGGAALFVANSEVRFPIHRWIRGVGFVDLGDIYPTVGDLLTSVQVSTGGGIPLGHAGRPAPLRPRRAGQSPADRSDVAVPLRPRPLRSNGPQGCYLPRTVRMIDSTAGRSGAFGASFRKFSK